MSSADGEELSLTDNLGRTTQFWLRSAAIYAGYKATQLRALALRAAGRDPQRIKREVWDPQQERAATQMYNLCVDLRGFYLKSGQFLGSRADFVPEQICRKLSLLHDQVPAMPAAQVAAVIQEELGGVPLDHVFEWIDLEHPLGSASIAQVHKARLKPLPRRRRGWFPLDFFLPFLRGDDNNGGRGSSSRGSSTSEIAGGGSSGDASLLLVAPSPPLRHATPPPLALQPRGQPPVDLVLAWQQAPPNGVVAVKVQYPNALPTMSLDLQNIRLLAAFLSKTELKFDMLSAVDELAKQIRLEFDFKREARVMDAVARQFEGLGGRIQVPRSVPSMVTPRLLTMTFLDGISITRLKDQPVFQNLSEATKRLAARRILTRVSEAYGRMLLLDGLFQADGHPGNILVMKGGTIGLIDYGQSKRLPDCYRAAFARLVLAIHSADKAAISGALDALGVRTDRHDVPLKAQLAVGMFDTSGKVDPFDPDSPIKKMGISTFPADMFFVLRVVQLLRGLASGMGVGDFSSARQWRPFAEDALRQLRGVAMPAELPAFAYRLEHERGEE